MMRMRNADVNGVTVSVSVSVMESPVLLARTAAWILSTSWT
jgi:hypothetical protein